MNHQSTLTVEKLSESKVAFVGDVIHETVNIALNSKFLFSENISEIDFKQVNYADSSCLALMVLLIKQGNSSPSGIIFRNVPEKLVGLAKVSNLEGILKLSQSDDVI